MDGNGGQALALREAKARDKAVIEKRRQFVARLRYIEANLTAEEIRAALAKLDPPIVVSVTTVERDIRQIAIDARKHLNLREYDGRVDVMMKVTRLELLARRATSHALGTATDGTTKGKASWARVAVQATEASMKLLMDVGLVDRHLGTMLFGRSESTDPDKGDRIPNAAELHRIFESARIEEHDLIPSAEREWIDGEVVHHGGGAHGEAQGGGQAEGNGGEVGATTEDREDDEVGEPDADRSSGHGRGGDA